MSFKKHVLALCCLGLLNCAPECHASKWLDTLFPEKIFGLDVVGDIGAPAVNGLIALGWATAAYFSGRACIKHAQTVVEKNKPTLKKVAHGGAALGLGTLAGFGLYAACFFGKYTLSMACTSLRNLTHKHP